MGKIVLVTGGARSGKSAFAERYAACNGEKIAYIATAEALDDEMKFRIRLHQERRPATWKTFEAPYDTHRIITSAGNSHDVLLFDCVTIYLSNVLSSENAWEHTEKAYTLVEKKITALLQAAQKIDGMTIFVTNEVGDGIVPEQPMARFYRDLAGFANQILGKGADEVYLVTCGIAVDLKKIAEAY